MIGISTFIASASSVGTISRRFSVLIVGALLLGCKENEVNEGGEAGRYGNTGDATLADPPALRTAERSPDESSQMPPKFPIPSKEYDHRAAEYEDLVMNHPGSLLDKLKSLGAGRARGSYISEIFSRLTMYSDSDPEIASSFLEILDRSNITDDEARHLSNGARFVAKKLGYDESVKMHDRLSTSQMKQLVAKGIGMSLAEIKAIPSEQELNHFDEDARVRLLGALNGNLKFESADELALFVETYEEKGELYRPLVDGEIGNVTRLDPEELIYSASRLSNPAAADKVFGYGMTNFISQDALAASQYLADNKGKLDARLYRFGAKILSAYLERVGDKDDSAMWMKEAESN